MWGRMQYAPTLPAGEGGVPIILTITTAPPDITKAGATLHCFRNVGPGLIASVRL